MKEVFLQLDELLVMAIPQRLTLWKTGTGVEMALSSTSSLKKKKEIMVYQLNCCNYSRI